MKKGFETIAILLTPIVCFGQRGERGGSERGYEVIGLPAADEIIESLQMAIPALIIGLIISYIFMWSEKGQSRTDNLSRYISYIGMILMVFGLICLLPLWAWIEYFYVNILILGTILTVIMGIIYGIYSLFTKK